MRLQFLSTIRSEHRLSRMVRILRTRGDHIRLRQQRPRTRFWQLVFVVCKQHYYSSSRDGAFSQRCQQQGHWMSGYKLSYVQFQI
ncbi:MAG: hypothetical protein EXS30_03965 [Pedosphaera sp.]|nr:hypothetical protein [Pedosphaera sp.]